MTKIKSLKIATRNSPLALWQAHFIRNELIKLWPTLIVELVPMTTSGDTFLKDKLLAIGGKGLFVKELEEALLDGRADIAVHSMKDVPTYFPDGLSLPIICKRENPFDAFLSMHYQSLMELPEGAVIGTASLRRQAQLLNMRPDLIIKPLRGNIQTRIKHMEHGDFDAIILACAGLERMELTHLIKERLSLQNMLPACGQGALGIECRTDDEAVMHFIRPLSDTLSTICVSTERQVNAQLGGNCHVPLAVFCEETSNNLLLLRAKVLTSDGKTMLYEEQMGQQNDATTLANHCAEQLLQKGASRMLHTDTP
jgi:hydroxymethylbilane synthase